MSKFSKFLSLVAAALFAFVGSASAQLQTYETQSAYRGSATTFAGATYGETFNNVSAVKSMTYNFFVGQDAATSTATSLSAVFGQWNTGTNSFVSGTTVSFGTIVVPDSSTWTGSFTNNIGTNYNTTFSYQFDLTTLSDSMINATYGYLTNSSNTYALMLTDLTGNTNLALGATNSSSAFAFGDAFVGDSYFRDWVFAQIVVAPGNQVLVPVPESGTVASVVVGLMVVGLVGFRMNQRRRAQVAPLAA